MARSNRFGKRFLAIGSCIALLAATTAQAVTISFDYTFDTNDFFDGNATANASLIAAGNFFSTNWLMISKPSRLRVAIRLLPLSPIPARGQSRTWST